MGNRAIEWSVGKECPCCEKSLRTDGDVFYCSYLKCEDFGVLYDAAMMLIEREVCDD